MMLNTVLEKFGRYLHTLDLSSSPRSLTDFSLDIIGMTISIFGGFELQIKISVERDNCVWGKWGSVEFLLR